MFNRSGQIYFRACAFWLLAPAVGRKRVFQEGLSSRLERKLRKQLLLWEDDVSLLLVFCCSKMSDEKNEQMQF